MESYMDQEGIPLILSFLNSYLIFFFNFALYMHRSLFTYNVFSNNDLLYFEIEIKKGMNSN